MGINNKDMGGVFMRKLSYILIIVLVLILPLGCSSLKGDPIKTFVYEDTNYISKVENGHFHIYKDDHWEKLIIKGVNFNNIDPDMKEKDYIKHFHDIGEMNANTVRVNTLQPPEFYKALYGYNRNTEKPLYLFQGVLIDHVLLNETQDPFKLDNIVPFKEEIDKTIDAIHGKEGKYNTDLSPYLMGYIIGSKWKPEVVDFTNRNRADKKEFEGEFVFTNEARPFEHFLANIIDHTLLYEKENYKWGHPISFVNSVTTDILSHPYEPLKEDDFVSINPNVIYLKSSLPGQFASYEVYPFYPEFLNLNPKYTKFIDNRGKVNNYAGYLKDLIQANDLPVLITDFGLPSSRGLSIVSVHGYNKGFLSEETQGTLVANMFQDIISQGGAGGIISNWQDQWENWSDAQNSNEQFGILSFDRLKVKVDGDLNDWKKNKTEALYSTDKKSENKIKNLYVDHDERYLYFAIQKADLKSNDFDTLIFLDVIKDAGKSKNPFNSNITVGNTDYLIHITENGLSKILKADNSNEELDSFIPIRLVLSEEIVHYRTGQKIPSMNYETGILRQGNGNPDSKYYDSLADYNINSQNTIIEIRIPWSLVGFTDPSTKTISDDIKIGGINVSVAIYPKAIPEEFNILPDLDTVEERIYTWDNWDEAIKSQRLKASYPIIKEMFGKY